MKPPPAGTAWTRPAAAADVAGHAARCGVRRLVFPHTGRPTTAATDAGHLPPFGEFGAGGTVYTPSPAGCSHG